MWDYVIIGAGTAGSVLAHELTATGKNKVLLVEAGGKPPLMTRIPAGMPKLFNSKQDWAFESEPQKACYGRSVFTPRGKMLGGSSNMNAQIHQWCHPADFDGWRTLGADGWSWEDVRPVFRAMECLSGAGREDQQRGDLGPMHIARTKEPNPLATAFVASARAVGIDGTEDYNGCAYSGAWLTQQAHRGGCRFSVYDAYLKPAMKRPNLKVMSDAQIERILFENKRATGVRLKGDSGASHRVARGVILAAGAFGSPQLLMLSGIGPESHLRNHGIIPVCDSPEVGENLQDHPLTPMKFTTRKAISLKSADGIGQLIKWLLFRRGMLTSNIAEAMAFTSVLDQRAPDLELLLAAVEWQGQGLQAPTRHAYTIGVIPVAPKSRGTLRLRSGSPHEAPAIDFRLLSDTEGADAKVLLEGAKLARRVASTKPLSSATLEEFPESASAQSDGELLDYLKSEIQTVYHPTSTCRMGSDEAAPVDPRLKVRGVEGLWVIDASVMPTVPRGHPNAVVAMIANRAAEWLN